MICKICGIEETDNPDEENLCQDMRSYHHMQM